MEISNLKLVVKILSDDKSKKTIITDYQFLAPIMKIYDYSPNQWHHATVSFPIEGQKYFKEYKYFFINNLKKNKIDFIFETASSIPACSVPKIKLIEKIKDIKSSSIKFKILKFRLEFLNGFF